MIRGKLSLQDRRPKGFWTGSIEAKHVDGLQHVAIDSASTIDRVRHAAFVCAPEHMGVDIVVYCKRSDSPRVVWPDPPLNRVGNASVSALHVV